MHSTSKTQQVIATSSAEAELYAISSTISDAINLKQLITEIENNIGIKTFDLNKHNPNMVLFCDSSSGTSLVQPMGVNKRTKHIQFRFCGFRICIKLGSLFFVVFQQRTTQPMLSPRLFQLLLIFTTSSRCWSSDRCCQRSGGIQQHLPCR